MICGNGVQLTARSSHGGTIAAKGFFSLFYQWSRAECLANRKHGSRSIAYHCTHWTAATVVLPTKLTTRRNSSHSISIAHSLSEPLRHLMRFLPAPIVVLTTSLPSSSPSASQKPQYRGMTLSSFTTLTLTPEPIVTFNIRSTPSEPSRTLAALEANQSLLIHLLEDTAEGAGIAHGFTMGNEGDVFTTTEASVSEERTETGRVLPRLTGKGIRKVLKCEILQPEGSADMVGRAVEESRSGLIRVGDHVLVVAQVKEILDPESDSEGIVSDNYGLSYANGKYRQVGNTIDLADKTGP